jgi:hypothetical protein
MVIMILLLAEMGSPERERSRAVMSRANAVKIFLGVGREKSIPNPAGE